MLGKDKKIHFMITLSHFLCFRKKLCAVSSLNKQLLAYLSIIHLTSWYAECKEKHDYQQNSSVTQVSHHMHEFTSASEEFCFADPSNITALVISDCIKDF